MAVRDHFRITPAQVQELCDERGIGIQQARQRLEHEALVNAVADIETVEDVKIVLTELVEFIRP
jgi:hypothetical protein